MGVAMVGDVWVPVTANRGVSVVVTVTVDVAAEGGPTMAALFKRSNPMYLRLSGNGCIGSGILGDGLSVCSLSSDRVLLVVPVLSVAFSVVLLLEFGTAGRMVGLSPS